MKCITFIGVGRPKTRKYDRANYYFKKMEKETEFIQEAICEFFKPEELYVMVTDQAMENYRKLESKLKENNLVRSIKTVKIPAGKNVDELWEIFRKISSVVEEGDSLIFDITHGLRSLPFVCFLSIAYLKEVKNVKIEKVVYGAYEARDERGTPILDLTEITTLLDWLNAVRDFLKFGDATNLGKLMEEAQNRAYKEKLEFKPVALKSFAQNLEEFSLAVHLSRPKEAITSAGKVVELIDPAEKEIEVLLPPATHVIDKIKEIKRFAGVWGESLDFECIKKQMELIKYQLELGLFVQAAELARELLVSYLIYRLNYRTSEWLERDIRRSVELSLGHCQDIIRKEKEGRADEINLVKDAIGLLDMEDWKSVVKLWMEISEVRNDLAHCGMNPHPIDINRVEKRVREIVEKLERLILENSSH